MKRQIKVLSAHNRVTWYYALPEDNGPFEARLAALIAADVTLIKVETHDRCPAEYTP